MKFIKLTVYEDNYRYDGPVVRINPDEISSYTGTDRNMTRIKMRDGSKIDVLESAASIDNMLETKAPENE